MGPRADALEMLESADAEIFLIALLCELGLRGRGQYVEAGNTETAAITGLHCMNELLLATSQRLRALRFDHESYESYPNDAFFAALEQKAADGDRINDFQFAVIDALAFVRSNKPTIPRRRLSLSPFPIGRDPAIHGRPDFPT